MQHSFNDIVQCGTCVYFTGVAYLFFIISFLCMYKVVWWLNEKSHVF
jgi:hypothetical protein